MKILPNILDRHINIYIGTVNNLASYGRTRHCLTFVTISASHGSVVNFRAVSYPHESWDRCGLTYTSTAEVPRLDV